MNDNMFAQIDFGDLKQYIDNDDITDISYNNNGQISLKTLSKGIYRVENPNIKKMDHISETDLDNYDKFDYIINNNGTLLDLYKFFLYTKIL